MKHLLQAMLIAMVFAAVTPLLRGGTFSDEVIFLKKHTEIIVLSNDVGVAKVAVAPDWQGRVMTSTASGDIGRSFGWINHALIASGQLQPHMNAFGGEDRFWLGPEGGQFSIYFPKDAKFEFANWFVPAPFDTAPFKTVSHTQNSATFDLEFVLTNYSGTRFDVEVTREIRLIDYAAAWKDLNVPENDNLSLVAYESDTRIFNAGKSAWEKDTGLLSIWILGMFTPSPAATIVVPIKAGPESKLGVPVTSDYFGAIPSDRLVVRTNLVFLRGDGKYRSKIGINPLRSKGVLGAYDAEHQVLTIVQFDQPASVTDYVNSLWKIQDNPYGGDVANAYNDGPPTPDARPLGPFFEMESSSPALALAPGKSASHLHRTIHLTGPEAALDPVARALLGISITDIRIVFAAGE